MQNRQRSSAFQYVSAKKQYYYLDCHIFETHFFYHSVLLLTCIIFFHLLKSIFFNFKKDGAKIVKV